MKKVFSLLMIAAVAVMSFSSCQQELTGKKGNSVHFVLRAGSPQTRTYIDNNLDGTYTVGWNANDDLALFFGDIVKDTDKADYIFNNTASKGETATFEGDANVIEDGTFLSFYPARALAKTYNGTVGVDIKDPQNPTCDSFDPACDILVAKPCDYVVVDGEVLIDDLYFTRILSVLKVNLKSSFADIQGEIVKNFRLSVPDDYTLTGRPAINLESATITKWNVSKSYVAAKFNEDVKVNTELENAIYLVVNPVTIESGSDISFTIETENYNITKNITLSKALSFPQGNIAVINLNIIEDDCDAKSTEIITGTDEITRELTGIENGATNYENWTNIQDKTSAKYAGNSAGSYNSIQLRSKNSNSGIVSTTSAGIVTNVTIQWNTNTSSTAKLDIYGSNIPYSEASDLYSTTNKGTKIGSLSFADSETSLDITGSYKYIGIRSNSGALYLDKVSITWGKEPDAVAVSDVTLDKSLYELSIGGSTTLTATIAPTNATNKNINWTSSNESIATVDQTGKVTAKSAGTAIITATTEDGNFTATCNVTVTAISEYSSLAALVEAVTPTADGVTVTVTLTDEVITGFYTTSSSGVTYRNGVYFNVNNRDVEIYCKNVPAEWEEGGTVSGTLTCLWKNYNGIWELTPSNYGGLSYKSGGTPVTPPSGETTTYTYTFTSKAWADATSSWTNGKEGNQLTDGQGIQITNGVTGANATSKSPFTNVSKIVVKYCTNAKAGKGSINLQVGSGTTQSFPVTAPSSGGTTLKETEFVFNPSETGKVKITVECSTNSIYIYSIAITAN